MIIISLIILLISVIIHEIAHAYVAFLFGDHTAAQQGRLTLNPIVHLDLVGSIILPLILYVSSAGVLFGWAKPVPINLAQLKHVKWAVFFVALAGPISNFILVIACFLLSVFFNDPLPLNILFYAITLNFVLAFFNLFPCPPLDGSKLIACFLPEKWSHLIYRYENFGMILLFILLYFGALNFVFSYSYLLSEKLFMLRLWFLG